MLHIFVINNLLTMMLPVLEFVVLKGQELKKPILLPSGLHRDFGFWTISSVDLIFCCKFMTYVK